MLASPIYHLLLSSTRSKSSSSLTRHLPSKSNQHSLRTRKIPFINQYRRMATSSTSSSTPTSSVPPGSIIPIKDLVVTQFGYRDDAGVKEMIRFVDEGGEFSARPQIALFELDDGRLYIHDGHHRSMAIYLSGRPYLLASEYQIKPHTFSALNSVNFEAGYVTPYDPRTEMRLSDFRLFKATARRLQQDTSNPNRIADAMKYISENRRLYCITHRPYETIPEMARYLGLLEPGTGQAKL